jgi:hypothetical protein
MNKSTRPRLSRPQSARAVARRAASLGQFGLNLRDWFHELRHLSTRAQLREAVKVRPPRLTGRFPDGAVADAFLAAQVEYFCHRAKVRPPRWTRDPVYVLDDPWFSAPGPRLRAHLLLDTPNEFRNRNLFTTPEFELKIRRGRPRVSLARKREKARLRQQRFRQRLRRPRSAPPPSRESR